MSKKEEVDKFVSDLIVTSVSKDNVIYIGEESAPYWQVFGEVVKVKVRCVLGNRGEKMFVMSDNRVVQIHLYKYFDVVQKGCVVGTEFDVNVIYRMPVVGSHTEEEEKMLREKKPYALYHWDRVERGIMFMYTVFDIVIDNVYYNFYKDYKKVSIYGGWKVVEDITVDLISGGDEVALINPYYGKVVVQEGHKTVLKGYWKYVGEQWSVKIATREVVIKGVVGFDRQTVLVGSDKLPGKE